MIGNATPLVGEDGQPRGAVGAFLDITELTRAEHALRESEERFRLVADTAPVLIWTSGADKLCTFTNKGWLDFTGRSMAQELGTGWSFSIHPDDRDRVLATYAGRVRPARAVRDGVSASPSRRHVSVDRGLRRAEVRIVRRLLRVHRVLSRRHRSKIRGGDAAGTERPPHLGAGKRACPHRAGAARRFGPAGGAAPDEHRPVRSRPVQSLRRLGSAASRDLEEHRTHGIRPPQDRSSAPPIQARGRRSRDGVERSLSRVLRAACVERPVRTARHAAGAFAGRQPVPVSHCPGGAPQRREACEGFEGHGRVVGPQR